LFVCLFNYIFSSCSQTFMCIKFDLQNVYVVRNRKSCFILFQARFWCGIRRSSTLFFFFQNISFFIFKVSTWSIKLEVHKNYTLLSCFFYFCGCVLNKPLQTFISLSCSVVVVVVIIEVCSITFIPNGKNLKKKCRADTMVEKIIQTNKNHQFY